MKTPAELAARLRKMVLAAQHHYSPTGEPLRSIVVTPEWLEDMADAANALDGDQVAQCTNGDQWNCKYCRKTETCEAIKDPRNFGKAVSINKI